MFFSALGHTYDAWGNTISATGNSTLIGVNPIRYKSYYYDSETGFFYLQSRYYDPQVGRFINADDWRYLGIGNSMVCGLFPYCENRPVLYSDSNGYGPWNSYLTLSDYRKIHNYVADIIRDRLKLRGCNAVREKYVKGEMDGKTVRGFLDVYDEKNNAYYEVKHDAAAYTTATANQMRKYDHSKPLFSQRGNVVRGSEKWSGAFYYGAWYIEYKSSDSVKGLVIYTCTFDQQRANDAKLVAAGVIFLAATLFTIATAGAGAPSYGALVYVLV